MQQIAHHRTIFRVRWFFGCAAIAAASFCGTSLQARTTAGTPQHIAPTQGAIVKNPLDTRLNDDNFNRAQAMYSSRFAGAPKGKRSAAGLDYAQFLIGWMMLPEAQDIAEFVLNTPDATQYDRAKTYLAMIKILSGKPITDNEVPAALRLDSIWSVIVDLKIGNTVETDRLHTAASKLDQHSYAVSSRLVPIIFEAAIDAADLDFARNILNASGSGTDLTGTSEMLLMRGLLARAEGQKQNAFDFFAWASEQQGRAAAQARIELADMALENPDRAVRERVRDLLVEGLARWRGDDLALRMRALLARVSEDLGDAETAIVSMSLLHADHPDTPEADLAQRRIAVILKQVGEAIDADAMDLQDSLAMVRRLEPYMNAHAQRVAVRGALANRFRRAGLSVAAEAEYADILDGLLEEEREEISPALLDRLLLEQAKRYLREETPAAARNAISQRPEDRQKELDAEFAKIELMAGRRLTLTENASIALEIGRYALQRGNEDAALEAFNLAGSLPPADGINAARIAASQGQSNVSEYLSNLSTDRRDQVVHLSKIRATEAPLITPLSVEAARGIIERATTALEAVETLNASN